MIGKTTIRRGGAALCLAGALMMTGFGCQPAGNSGSKPAPNKPADQKPDNKPIKQPAPDVG